MATHDMIVVGASAGGVQALTKLVTGLPPICLPLFSLQATNEELQTTNDELTARTIELHHLTRENAEEQYRLSELLERFPYYVVVVSARDLTILAVNPGYALLLGKRQVIGQPVNEFFSGKDLDMLMEILREAAIDGKAVTTPPMAVRAADYEGHNEDLYVHSPHTSGRPTIHLY